MSKFLFDYMKREQMNFCISLIEASFIKNIGKLDYEYESKKISAPPWSWFNQENLYFYTLKEDNLIIAYVIWRIKNNISHLHSFLVSAEFQRQGIGKILLKQYEEKSKQINPNIQIFTLHTYDDTKYNHIFYSKSGYKKYKKHDENKITCLTSWIENCKTFNDWPLRDNKVLFYKHSKQNTN